MPLASARANKRIEPTEEAAQAPHSRVRSADGLTGHGRGGPKRSILAAAGGATVLLCAALGAEVAAVSNQRHPYLAMAQYVPFGAVISAADLQTVDITPAGGLAAIPAAEAGSVLGRHASTALEPGGLLVTGDLGAGVTLAAGTALVGTSLNADQVPLGLQPGDDVLVLLGGASAGPSSSTSGSVGSQGGSPGGHVAGLLARGVVVTIESPPGSSPQSGGGDLVTIELPTSSAPEVAAASAQSDVTLAKVPGSTAK